MNQRPRRRIEGLRMNEALAELARKTKRPRLPDIDFNIEFDPRQDLLYEGSARKRGLYRQALELLRAGAPGADAQELWVVEGAVHFSFGRFARARRTLAQGLKRDPRSIWGRLWRFRATAYQAMSSKSVGLLDDALRQSEEILGEGSHAFFVHAWRAELLTGFDLHAQALRDLERCLELKPDYGWAYAEKADIYTQQRKLEPALLACNRLIALNANQGWAYAIRGRAWGKCGRAREALADLDKGVRLGPVMGSMHAWRGEAHRQMRNCDLALADFDAALVLDPSYPLTYMWRGAALLAKGRIAEAVVDLSRSIRLDPRNLLAHAWRAEAFLKQGRFEECLRDLDEFHPSSARETWTGGEAALWRDLDHAVGAHARDPLARACRGRLLLENPQARLDGILEDLDAAAAHRRARAWGLAWRAQARQRAGDRKAALRDFDSALKLKPSWSWPWAWRGRLKLEMEGRRDALDDLSRSIRLKPAHGEVYAWRSLARARMGQEALAKVDMEHARALGYRP